MTEYVSASAFLSEVQLRVEAHKHSRAAVVVEGQRDKEVFINLGLPRELIAVSNGRQLLIDAHAVAGPADFESIAFVTDCDYEVPLGTLRGGPGLFITNNADLESDLLRSDLGRRLVSQLIPGGATLDDADANRAFETALDRAEALALPLGKMRLLARRESFDLGLENQHGVYLDRISFSKHRDNRTLAVDEDKLIRTAYGGSEGCTLSADQLIEECQTLPNHGNLCNGKDLIAALCYVLRTDFRVRRCSWLELDRLLRFGAQAEEFTTTALGGRLERWRESKGVELFG